MTSYAPINASLRSSLAMMDLKMDAADEIKI